ncbi:MAG: UbiD family decarboxylase [Streptosporangiales bacterium]|nr:UbiD family decarboxylase [Streptosporangiales bacterium]
MSQTREPARSLRETIDFLRSKGQLLESAQAVDPNVGVIALQKHFDGGPGLLFNDVKGYPDHRIVTNVIAREDILTKLFPCDSPRELKRRFQRALTQPVAPRLVESAPVQEVVITDDVDVWREVPMVSHTFEDPGRTLGGGITCVTGRHFWGGSHIAFNRMNFRGKDFSSFQISPGSHGDMIATEFYRKERVPMTINIGVPPAVTITASSAFDYLLLPKGSDELGVAGAFQGFPVDVVRAKTVDALAIAESEIVIEGYLDTEEKVWESPLAEEDNAQGQHPFHPEWAGYMGKAYRTYKFTATAITRRADRPIYHALGVHMQEVHNACVIPREAALLELADRIEPGLVTDVHVPWAMTEWGGAVFQVKKRRQRDEGAQINIMDTILAASRGMRVAITVDDDIDIYDLNDVVWAATTRVNPATDVHRVAIGGVGQTFQPGDRASAGAADWTASNIRFPGGVCIDATAPFAYRDAFDRPTYPIDAVDPATFFGTDAVASIRREQAGQWLERLAAKGL